MRNVLVIQYSTLQKSSPLAAFSAALVRRRRPLTLATAAPKTSPKTSVIVLPPYVCHCQRPQTPTAATAEPCPQRCLRRHMPHNAFHSLLTGAPCRAARQTRSKNQQWIHLSAGEILTRKRIHELWAMQSLLAMNSYFLAGYAIALWLNFVGRSRKQCSR